MTLQEFRSETRSYFYRQSRIEHPELDELQRAVASDLFMQWAMRFYVANQAKFSGMPSGMLAGAFNAVLPNVSMKAKVH
ncbi:MULTISPECIES: hypothetical protein [Acidobacterium]|uniref:hypothetical protein n=1 Tax=Acidobacterium TaxID=33973 RepID=UPI0002DF89AA|nr:MULTISPECIES: hypothetical protein [Acidobacterium]HCT62074.1 hypothetical protein [Acidobacterium sp.]